LSRKRCLDCQVSFFDRPCVACNVFSWEHRIARRSCFSQAS
jgi:hypothetical protein